MIDLTTIFGDEIKVYRNPRLVDRQYTGFPGAHGLTGMNMGSRGSLIFVTGKIWGSGANYSAARADCQAWLDSIEDLKFAASADYEYEGEEFPTCIVDEINIVPDDRGKAFHYTSAGYVTLDFVAILRSLA